MTPGSALRPAGWLLLLLALAASAPRVLHAQQGDLHVRIETIEGALAFNPVAKTSVIPLNQEVTFRIWVANRGAGDATGALVNGGADPAFFEIRTATIDPAVAVCEVNPLGFFICPQMTLAAGDSALVQVTGAGLVLTTAAQKAAGVLFSTTTGGPNAGSDSDLTDMEIVMAAQGSFQGVAFLDLNGDGVQQPDEPGLAGRMIYNDINDNAQYDPGVDPSMPTDAAGFYAFTDVPLPVTVGQDVPPGWESTFPEDDFYTIEDDSMEVNFGSRPLGTTTTDLGILKRVRSRLTGEEIDPGDTLAVARGDTMSYRISVANTSTFGGGPNDSPDTAVLDQLPTDVDIVSVVTSRGTCSYDAATRLVTCELGTVAAGEQLLDVIEITIVVTGASGTVVSNTAGVVGDLPDPEPINNESTVTIVSVSQTATTQRDADLPDTFVLFENYPNPFNPTTTLRYDLPEAALLRVEVIDLLGRRVLALPPRRFEAGRNQQLRVEAGALASGLYLYQVVAEAATRTYRATGRFLLVK